MAAADSCCPAAQQRAVTVMAVTVMTVTLIAVTVTVVMITVSSDRDLDSSYCTYIISHFPTMGGLPTGGVGLVGSLG